MEESDRSDQEKLEQLQRDHHHRRGRQSGNGTAENSHYQPPQPHRKCPRCDSSNTKFCYYNNYSLLQPRHFCKACRRYWTHGGALRNVPFGGGCRMGKRRPRTSLSAATPPPVMEAARTRSLSPAIPSPNLTAVIPSGESAIMGSLPAVPAIVNPYYAGGGFLSSLDAVQSASNRANQGGAANFDGGGGGGGGGANMALLHGINLPSFNRFPAHNEFFPSLNNVPPPAVGPWSTQSSFVAANSSTFWIAGASTTMSAVDNQAGSSTNRSQWSDYRPGFNHSE